MLKSIIFSVAILASRNKQKNIIRITPLGSAAARHKLEISKEGVVTINSSIAK